MIVQYIVFGLVLAIFPAFGAVAVHFSNKQRRSEAHSAHHGTSTPAC